MKSENKKAPNHRKYSCEVEKNACQKEQQIRKLEKKQDQKAAKTLSAILLAFIITWTPYNINVVISSFCPSCLSNYQMWTYFGKNIYKI